MNIAFTGWAGSGKTESAKYLRDKYGYNLLSFADGIKWIDKEIFGSTYKDRRRLQQIGELLRIIDPDVWVKHTIRRLDINKYNVIDDLRRLNEYQTLINHNFIVVRIVADEDIRIKRLIERDGHCDVSLLYNESENGCAELEFIEIENNGTLAELHSKLDDLMMKIIHK